MNGSLMYEVRDCCSCIYMNINLLSRPLQLALPKLALCVSKSLPKFLITCKQSALLSKHIPCPGVLATYDSRKLWQCSYEKSRTPPPPARYEDNSIRTMCRLSVLNKSKQLQELRRT